MKTDIPSAISVSELAEVLGMSRGYVIRRTRKLLVPSFTIGEGRNAKKYFTFADLEASRDLWAEIKWRTKQLGVDNFGDE